MGIKISSLPNNSLPYTGSEEIPLVQNGQTRAGTLSSFVNYLSGALLSDSELRALSGNWQNTYTTVTANSANWQNTYTTFRANSANYAVKNANNNFTVGQTVNGNVSATALTITGGTGTPYILRKFTSSDSFGINNSDFIESAIPSGAYIITLGKDAGGSIGGTGGISSEIIAIGHDSGKSIGASNTTDSVGNIIAIGYNAGSNIGEVAGTTSNIIAIGASAGNSIGKQSSLGATDVVCIGSSAGTNAGNGGRASNVVAIGTNTLYDSATTGGIANYIIGIGQGAGTSMGSNAGNANYIISIGSSAGTFVGGNTGSATSVTAIGNNAGSYAGDGGQVEDIIAVGSGAGEYIGARDSEGNVFGSASDIIAIGNLAGNQAGRGGADLIGAITNGILIGKQAGYLAGQGGSYGSPLSGSGDVNDLIAIGREAGYQSGTGTTSNNNIFIGLSSGYTKQGSRNTFVGDLTNTSPTSAVNLSGCIAIGYGATPTVRNTIALGSASTPLSVVPGRTFAGSLSGLRVMINGTYYTIPLLA
jgi:hypothetical protein